MASIHSINVGDKIQALKFDKIIIGTVTKKLPGAIVIINEKSEQLEVVDIDKVKKVLTNKQETK